MIEVKLELLQGLLMVYVNDLVTAAALVPAKFYVWYA